MLRLYNVSILKVGWLLTCRIFSRNTVRYTFLLAPILLHGSSSEALLFLILQNGFFPSILLFRPPSSVSTSVMPPYFLILSMFSWSKECASYSSLSPMPHEFSHPTQVYWSKSSQNSGTVWFLFQWPERRIHWKNIGEFFI